MHMYFFLLNSLPSTTIFVLFFELLAGGVAHLAVVYRIGSIISRTDHTPLSAGKCWRWNSGRFPHMRVIFFPLNSSLGSLVAFSYRNKIFPFIPLRKFLISSFWLVLHVPPFLSNLFQGK